MYDAGNPELVFCDNLEGGGGEGCSRGVQEGGDRCIPMANPCGGTAKTITTVQALPSP